MYESEIIEASNFDKVKTEYYVENLLENEDLSKTMTWMVIVATITLLQLKEKNYGG